MGVELVVRDLVPEEEPHEQAHGHPGCQPQNIDGGNALLLPEGAERNFQVVAEHDRLVGCSLAKLARRFSLVVGR